MRVVVDILFAIITSYITIATYRSLISFKNVSIAAFVIILCYIFNCLPIVFDILLGIPEYMFYYDSFNEAAQNDTVSIIYDVYILAVMAALYWYYKKNVIDDNLFYLKYDCSWYPFKFLLILSPLLVYIMYGGGFSNFEYGTLASRDVDSNVSIIINQLLFISLYFFCIWIFGIKKKWFTGTILFIFLILLSLISGKRFIIAVILFSYFFCFIYSRWQGKRKTHLTTTIITVSTVFIVFMIYYITVVKVMGDYSGYIYTQLRIDFGREDVTKFVILQELKGNPILDYRGESVISLILMAFPRALWSSKPWPHYRYLTGAIFGESVDKIKDGVTPSVFEMMIANFSFWGIIVAILLILALVKLGDRLKSSSNKFLVLIIIIQLFTQNLDVVLLLFYYFLFIVITYRNHIVKGTKIQYLQKHAK